MSVEQRQLAGKNGMSRKLGFFWSALTKDKMGFIGVFIVFGLILLSVVAPYIFPVESRANPQAIFQGPSSEHWLGTDNMGRDVWAQVANGGREIIFFSALTAFIAVFIGVALGAAAALLGGKFDTLMVFLADVWLTIPRFPLLVVLSGFFRLNSLTLAIILAVLSWAGLFRSVRAEVMSLRQREFIEAALMLDLGLPHIIFKEILPNMMAFVSMNFTLMMRHAIYAQVGLVFLGLLPLERNWGVMINIAWTQGVLFFPDAIWFILAPTIAIALLILGLVWMNRVLEGLFNPTLRSGG